MNKMDIVIGHIQNCTNYAEAVKKISDPLKGFGFKITKNEQILCLYYAKEYFKNA